MAASQAAASASPAGIAEPAALATATIGPGVNYLFSRANASQMYPGTSPNQTRPPLSLIESLQQRLAQIQSTMAELRNSAARLASALMAAPGKMMAAARSLTSIPQMAARTGLHLQLRKETRTDRGGLLSGLIKLLLRVRDSVTSKRQQRNGSQRESLGDAIA